MSEPIVYVSTWRIKPGRFEEYRRFYAALVEAVETNEPAVSAFLAFGSDDGSEITNVHVYADQVVLDRHMQVLGEQMGVLPGDLGEGMDALEPVQVQVLGRPSGSAAEMDRGLADSGVPFVTKTRFLGGFTRP
jgi:quinol monooxygenase YgiN